MTTVSDIIRAVEAEAPAALQESWDNTGLQVGDPATPVTGVMIGLDATPALIDEAIGAGCNMVITHHPLIFKGLKSITGRTPVERAVLKAIQNGVAVYSSHTALDNAARGVSVAMADRLGAEVISPLVPLPGSPELGTGVIARLNAPMTAEEFISRAKEAFNAPVARVSDPDRRRSGSISRIALCGGAGGSFIDDAVRAGADAYVTGDVRYHDFLDYATAILIVDIGHYETEKLTADLFADVIARTFRTLSVFKSNNETNPIKYL